MDCVYELLEYIRKCPNMYFGKKSLYDLQLFVTGYIAGVRKCDSMYKSDFENFNEFVSNYYKDPRRINWYQMISSAEEDDEKAMDIFFSLLDKYREQSYIPDMTRLYPFGEPCFKKQIYKEIHYTDHGNSKRYTNPHEHKIKWIDNVFYYDNLHCELNEIQKIYEKKRGGLGFDDIGEFRNYINLGGELEFEYNKKTTQSLILMAKCA